MIQTEKELIQYIKMMLGWPQLNVELIDDQISECIKYSIQKFTNVAYDGERTKYFKFMCEGRGEYKVANEVEEITQVNQSGIFYSGYDMNGYIDQNLSNFILNTSGASLTYLVTLSSTRSLTSKYFGNSVNFEFNSHKGILTIFQDFNGPLLIEAKCRYIPDTIDKIYGHEWVKSYAVERCRLLLSTVVGKYDQNLIGGGRINYADIRSLAQDELNKLEEELMEKWIEPAPFIIA